MKPSGVTPEKKMYSEMMIPASSQTPNTLCIILLFHSMTDSQVRVKIRAGWCFCEQYECYGVNNTRVFCLTSKSL